MFTSILDSQLTVISALICIGTALGLGLVLAMTYKASGRYSRNFFLTLFLLPMLVQVVIIMVNGNLGTSVAVLGAFSLIRFRSTPGNSRELLSIFLAMAIGLATGMGHIYFALTFTIIACLIIFLFTKTKRITKNLKIIIPEDLDYEEVFEDILKKYTVSSDLIQTKTINMGSLYELDYEIVLKESVNQKELIDDLRVRNGNLKIVLSQALKENEL